VGIAQTIVLVLTACSALFWLGAATAIIGAIRKVPLLARLPLETRASWPRVSVVIPACNEAATLEAAMRAKLEDDYPNLEFILVDDRSTDGTSAIVDRLAATDGRLRALHIEHLPSGWLGKLNALDVGVKRASGDWLLFTDADVHLVPGTLRRAIAWAEQRQLDHLTAFPQLWPVSFWLDATLSFFVRLVCLGLRRDAIEDPASSAAAGVGAFNLVRRDAFERTGGFEELRLEVGDDIALARMLKRSGARASIVNGRDAVGLHFYSSLAEMTRATEKNGYAVMGQYTLWRVVAGSTALVALELAPFLSLGVAEHTWVRALGGGTALVGLLLTVAANRWFARPLGPALAAPLGALLFSWMMLRSGWLGWRRGGLLWRGTLYPTEVLRAGRVG
jgi:glycosyltransferase involved in cell wall biosynthesis